MSENEFKGFEDFINYCKSFYDSGGNSGSSSNFSNDGYYCGDVPGGFQTIDPQLFLLIGELLGNVMAGKMPFNIQNVIGNWLQLVGQAIETYNAQQQYMQSGPGRYYDIRNLNINNPFCSSSQSSSGQSSYDESAQYINRNNTDTYTSNSSGTFSSNEMEKMKENICNLEKEIRILKDEIKEIKKNVE